MSESECKSGKFVSDGGVDQVEVDGVLLEQEVMLLQRVYVEEGGQVLAVDDVLVLCHHDLSCLLLQNYFCPNPF